MFAYIASMPQLSHSEATLYPKVFSNFEPFVMMTLCAKELDCTAPEIQENLIVNLAASSSTLSDRSRSDRYSCSHSIQLFSGR